MTTLTDVTLPLGHKLHVYAEAYNAPFALGATEYYNHRIKSHRDQRDGLLYIMFLRFFLF